MEQPETREFIIIVPTDEPGLPAIGDVVRADLEANFPGYTFTVVGSADLKPTYVAEGAERFVYDQMTVIPVMSNKASDTVPGAMLMNAPPPAELLDAIIKRLDLIESGKLAN